MNALLKMNDGPLTMTSKEMADLTEKRHDSVKRTIDTLVDKGLIAHPQIVGGEKAANGVVEKVYAVGKRDSYVIVAQLSPEFTARLVDRWQELEAGAPPMLNMRDPRQLANAALQLIEVNQELQVTIEQQQQKIAADAPKVDGYERIAQSDGSMCMSDAAKTLQYQPRKLTQLMQEHRWIFRRPMGSGWLAYQDRLQSRCLEHKVTTGEKSDGSEWTSTQVRVTAKGLTKLADLIRQDGMH